MVTSIIGVEHHFQQYVSFNFGGSVGKQENQYIFMEGHH
jgi:hypothetical protein